MTREKSMKAIVELVEGAIRSQDYVLLQRIWARVSSSRSFDTAMLDMFLVECAVSDDVSVECAGKYAAHVNAMTAAGFYRQF